MGIAITQPKSARRSFTLTLSLIARQIFPVSIHPRISAGRIGRAEIVKSAATTGARLVTIQDCAMAVGNHADGELVSSTVAVAIAAKEKNTTRLGTATTKNIRRRRERQVTGPVARRALVSLPTVLATRAADGEAALTRPRPRAELRGPEVDRDWGLVFLLISYTHCHDLVSF